jgi:hypothetical protein
MVALQSPLATAAEHWSRVDPVDGVPPRRMAHTAVFDPVRERMIVFGGANEMTGLLADIWSLSLEPEPRWTRLMPADPGPSARWDHAAVYDPIADRMLVFGGADSESNQLADVWALSCTEPPTWTEIHPLGAAPAGRSSHVAVFDPSANRLFVHGGFDGGIILRDDLWELSLAEPPTWRRVDIAGDAPIGRRDAVAVHDAPRSRILLHGGNGGFAPFLSDLWALDFATLTWTELEPSGTTPEGAITHAGAYDPARDRFILFGGSYHNQTWALPLATSLAWQPILPAGELPVGRIDHTLVYAPAADRLITFGGHTGGASLDDSWLLDPRDPSDAWLAAPELRLRVKPNPAVGPVVFSLPDVANTAAAHIVVYDVRGRVIRTLPARGRDAQWDLRDASGQPIAAGAYLCQMRAAGGAPSTAAVRVVIGR